jgi:3-dehydro-L-gulonate 2-dehydrogenase
MLRIPLEEMEQTIWRALVKARLRENIAATCARIYTESSCDGVFSLELNLVERLLD